MNPLELLERAKNAPGCPTAGDRPSGRSPRPPEGPARLRPAGWSDAYRLRAWRNDPRTFSTMGTDRPVGWLEHLRFMWIMRSRKDCRLFVAEAVDGTPVGTGHFYPVPGTDMADLSVTVDAALRDRGFGKDTVLELVRHATSLGLRSRARILATNHGSRRLFVSAGFRLRWTYMKDGREMCDYFMVERRL